MRTRRHATSSYSTDSIEVDDTGLAMSPSAFLSTPHTDAEEHQEALTLPDQVELAQGNTDAPVVRNRKRSRRFWNVLIRDLEKNGEVNRERVTLDNILDDLPEWKRVVVEWNHRNQPIGDSGGILARFLGCVVRSETNVDYPIGYEKWSAIPHHYKDDAWNYIKTKFEVNDAQHKHYIFKSMGKKWRDHRCKWYKYLQRCNFKPSWGSGDLYDFIKYRTHPDTEMKATQNTKNRRNLTTHHTLGSISFARLENELEAQCEKPITRVDLFQAGYTKKDGSFVKEAKKNHEQLVILSQTSSENDAYVRVFGKEHPGYIRGMGLGVIKSQIYGSSSSSSHMPYSSGPTQAEFDAMKEEIKELKERIAILTQEQHINTRSPVVEARSSQNND